ncbi:MAG: ABC transporter ATP-binding protein [Candidatus Sericytochromatia bacterium]|nr:ABC transporter ATP-binding protein [Candidatus Sericytochromatia bacterium]
MLALEARGLAKSYQGLFGGPVQAALQPTDLAVTAGERVALIGPNGSGKSTLLRLFATLVTPSAGIAWVLGRDVRRQTTAVRRLIAYVGGDGHGLDPRLTGRQNAYFRTALYGLDDRRIGDRLGALTETWQLADLLDRPVAGLSTGERQRLAIALALLPEPEVLLLDEPTRSLDPRLARQIWTWLRAWPVTILWASHDPDECLGQADRLVMLRAGAVVTAGTPGELAPHGRDDLLRWYGP